VSTKLQKVIGGIATLVAVAGATAGAAAIDRSAGSPAARSATPSSPSPSPSPSPTTSPTAAELAELAATAEGIGCVSTRRCTPTHGGAFISTSRNSCTAGLPVRTRGGSWYLLTAGHCVANARGATWRASGYVLGNGTRWQYAGLGTEGRAGSTDIGIIRITANGRLWNARSRVMVVGAKKVSTQRIVKAGDARVGSRVCVTGGRTGATRCGTVVTATTALRYASPGLAARTVQGLALVKGICVNPGDSGSPVFAGSTAVGIAVARSASGCYMWYSKITTPLRQLGLRVIG
jgi:V8-like Glu-specific endopeptidase